MTTELFERWSFDDLVCQLCGLPVVLIGESVTCPEHGLTYVVNRER